MRRILVLAALSLAGCGAIGGSPSFKVQAEGGPSTEDASTTPGYGTSRTIVQRYRFTSSDIGRPSYRMLAVKVTLNAAGDPPQVNETAVMLTDGVGVYQCSKYYTEQEASEGPGFKPPVCTFMALGLFNAEPVPAIEVAP